MAQHVRELWAVVMDRRHAAGNVAKRASLKEEWLKLSRVLADMRNRRGKLMPGWGRASAETDLHDQVATRAMAQAEADAGSG